MARINKDTSKKDLEDLLAKEQKPLGQWFNGTIPSHYKRLTVPMEKAIELAYAGAAKIAAYFGDQLHFTQSVIAGACFSGEYDNIIVVTPSQYGKSWAFARIALAMAYEGQKNLVAAGTEKLTRVIMNHLLESLDTVVPEVRNTLLNRKDQLTKLKTKVSKTAFVFENPRGSVEAISLAANYKDALKTDALGIAGNVFLDEAARVPVEAFQELGRGEYAQHGDKRHLMCMISNPHQPGVFYDELTQEDPDDRTLIIWSDVLTAIEEGVWTADFVRNTRFAKHRSTRKRYLLCELEDAGGGMFDEPLLYSGEDEGEYKQYFLGVDAAYKGKDNIEVCLLSIDGDATVRVEDVATIEKENWIDGVTTTEITEAIVRMARRFSVGMICVDVGWGVWLVDGLVKAGLPVRGVHFQEGVTKTRLGQANNYSATNAANMRAEMHLDLQVLIDDGKIKFHEDVYKGEIQQTLPLVTSERKGNGKLQVRPKPEIKKAMGKSPDKLDAVLLAIHALMLFVGDGVEFITEGLHGEEEKETA